MTLTEQACIVGRLTRLSQISGRPIIELLEALEEIVIVAREVPDTQPAFAVIEDSGFTVQSYDLEPQYPAHLDICHGAMHVNTRG